MATHDTHSTHSHLPAQTPTHTAIKTRIGIPERWRQNRAERRRRVTVQLLRRTANHTEEPHPIARRRQALLHHRAAAVRADLLEIAAMLERAHDPDPASVTALHQLLTNGCDSPLYNPDIHFSELRATLHYLRTELLTQRSKGTGTRVT